MAGQQRPPLAHIRVIDLTRARSGPTTARQFADWGADVIMVEARSLANDLTGDRQGSDFQNLHRNKRSIALDLKLEADRAIFLDLVATADVLLENFRPDVKRRLGIDYETLRLINPRLVYGSISGFGEDGPNALRPGVDQIAQGYGGLMSVTGLPGQGPIRSGFAVTDITAGLHVAIGCMVALLEREITGTGRWVRGSLLQSSIALLDFQATRWLVDGVVPEQEGNQHPTAVPMGAFETADGMVNIAAAGEAMFGRFCKIVGREAWLGDERFATNAARAINRDELLAEVTAVVKLRSSDYWISELNAAGVACGPVNTVETLSPIPRSATFSPPAKWLQSGWEKWSCSGRRSTSPEWIPLSAAPPPSGARTVLISCANWQAGNLVNHGQSQLVRSGRSVGSDDFRRAHEET